MQNLIVKTDNLLGKARKLREANQKLHDHRKDLENQLKHLQQQLDAEVQKNNELNNKIKIIKLAQNISTGNGDSSAQTELKRKINEYIREIDNCIMMLND